MHVSVSSQGNEDNTTAALKKYSDTVYRICFLYMKNKADAEDAFQDVFLKYIKAGKRFESDEHEKAWLCKVAFNTCKDMLKKTRKNIVSIETVAEPSYSEKQTDDVLDAVLGLPEKYKEVIYMHYYEGYTAAQIARFMKSRENTVYSQLSRARDILRERLGDDFED